ACNTTKHLCVKCFGDMTTLCDGITPVCMDDQCTGCTKHADCRESNACLADGSCAASTDIAYVDPAGLDNSECTKMSPCKKVANALMKRLPYVKLKGSIDEAVNIDNQNVTLLADQSVTLTRNQNGSIIQIMGTSTVEIDDLQIIGSNMNNTGISVSPSSNV